VEECERGGQSADRVGIVRKEEVPRWDRRFCSVSLLLAAPP
jgi:hypothetical protein